MGRWRLAGICLSIPGKSSVVQRPGARAGLVVLEIITFTPKIKLNWGNVYDLWLSVFFGEGMDWLCGVFVACT